MKNSIFLSVFVSLFISLNVNSQVDISSLTESISGQLTNEDYDEFDRANRSITSANEMRELLIDEDERLAKFFNKKEKKGEKKAIDAKEFRISMTKDYNEGLGILKTTLSNRLNMAIFEYPEDKAKVEKLKNQSDDNFSQAMVSFATYEGLEKKDLKGYGYYKLKDDLEGVIQSQIEGIEKLIDAFGIWAQQSAKREKDQADDKEWAATLTINSVDGYNGYINKYPTGKHMTEAVAKIAELEDAVKAAKAEAAKKAAAEAERKRKEAEAERLRKLAEQDQKPEGLVFSVQIMAVYFKVDSVRLTKIYNGDEEITERFDDGMYKYTIGEFATFEEAREFRKGLNIPSFIVAYQDGERISTVEAKKMVAVPKEE